ncbi:hypothetical protein K438DRAFT_1789225 [Mycena galopus ATCC 62051]|nr:hypothetical protein K438DRAFT_1789225 [Mycena galopus ATCC 62051]
MQAEPYPPLSSCFAASYSGSIDLPPRRRAPQLRRTTSLLISLAALPDLPTPQAVAELDDALDIGNIQADILVGMHKNTDLLFFAVADAATFKENDLGDPDFVAGQFNESSTVRDDLLLWDPAFAGTSIHAVFLLASDTVDNINTTLSSQHTIDFLAPRSRNCIACEDGISQPAVDGFTNSVLPGQTLSIFLLREDLDPVQTSAARTSWAKDGSFLVSQLTPEEGSELLSARMMGGASIYLAPSADDPILAADPTRNNSFTYLIDSDNSTLVIDDNHFNQTNCPFGAHIRRTHPRGDQQVVANQQDHFVIRSSISYGAEGGWIPSFTITGAHSI